MLAGSIAGLIVGAVGGYLVGVVRRRRESAEDTPLPLPPRAAMDPMALVPTVEEEIARAVSQGPPLTLFYLAWDAHDDADPSVRLIASLLVRLLRPYDAIVPLGEGRFVVVLPQVGEAAADTVASRLLQELKVLASVHLTPSETLLPRISLSTPEGVKALLDAARQASELSPPMRGDRGQLLKIGMTVLERADASLLGPLAPGTVFRLEGSRDCPSSRVMLVEREPMRVRPLDPLMLNPGESAHLLLEDGRMVLRGDVPDVTATEGGLLLAAPRRVQRVPRRRAERFRLRLPVQVADLEGVTLNVSADGFLALVPSRTFLPGQVLEGKLALPEEFHPVRVEVVKVRDAETSEGMILGCRFVALEPSSTMALVRLLSLERGSEPAC